MEVLKAGYGRSVFVYLIVASTLTSVFLFARFVFSADNPIVITEICPTGCASKDSQWIEIYNKSDEDVDVSEWKFIEQNTNHILSVSASSSIQSFILSAKSYAIIAQNDVIFFQDNPNVSALTLDSSWGTLNKTGELIALLNSDGDIVDEFTYAEVENTSLERIDVSVNVTDETNWKQRLDGTSVGQQNFWYVESSEEETESENQSPVAVIFAPTSSYTNTEVTFDASSSADNGTITSYVWMIENQEKTDEQVTHTFMTTGTYVIDLTVTDDNSATSNAHVSIQILEKSTDNTTPTPEQNTTSTPAQNVTSTDDYVGLVINEFVSNPEADKREWIELYNASDDTIDLSDVALYEGAGKIQILDGDLAVGAFLVVELSSSKLNNGGDVILLKKENVIINTVRYGDWVDDDDADVSDNAPVGEKGESVARIVDGQDTDNDKNDFSRTLTLTPSETNVITSPPQEESSPSNGSGPSSPTNQTPAITYDIGIIVINELVSDPTDEMEEFVELYNTSDEMISLENWHIEDGSEAKTILIGTIANKQFFVVEKPKGNLNNGGDIVILVDPTGKEIDTVTYGNWDDGNMADNAPAAEDPYSLIRKIDGLDADNDYYDFVLTATITAGKSNIVTPITNDEGETITNAIGSQDIIINEVFPNPEGSDSEDEFIELFNKGKETIDIAGWKVGDSSKKRYTIASGRITAGGYLVLKRSMTGIALNNTGGEEVKLFLPDDTLIDSMQYPGSAGEDESYVRTDDGSWKWTTKSTPGKENIVEGKSAAPIIAIDTETQVAVNDWLIFDASDTTDPDGDALTFVWDFGDGMSDDGAVVEHKFGEEGVYRVMLTVFDGEYESIQEVVVTVKLSSDFVGGYAGGDDVLRIRISEILPNPEGSDSTEFIELYNPSDTDIDFSGMKLDDEEGGSRAYTIPDGTIISARTHHVFGRQDTKIALNNTSDSVRILYPDGTPIAEVRYDDVVEDASYIQNDEGVWVWSSTVTPGEKNIFSAPKEVKGTKIIKKSKRTMSVIATTLQNLRNEDIGDKIKTTGVVVVLPGVLASQYFYIGDGSVSTSSLGGGVQVYMYNKDFPELKRGDKIQITGEISESIGEARVKLKEKSDIVILEHVGLPQPREIDIADIGEAYEGQLVSSQGEITELKGSYMYVDDGSAEIKVYFKRGAGIQKNVFNEGDLVRVAGLVHQTKNEFQLLPRAQDDIQKTGVVEAFVRPKEEGIEAQNTPMENYLTATAGGLTAIFFGLLAKSHGEKIITFLTSVYRRIRKKLNI